MNWIEALILGLIQGLTEFLPISSSGHLALADAFLGVKPAESLYFTIVVHGATVLSILFVFWQEISQLTKGVFQFGMNDEMKYAGKIVVSMIPVIVLGIFFQDFIENMFAGNLVALGIQFLITALLLGLAHFIRSRERNISYLDSFIIGIAQAIAVVPAISRSGATIATALLLGDKKEEAVKFSFLMVIFPVIGANLMEMLKAGTVAESISILSIIIGFFTAFISGYFACKWMILLVKKSKLIWFAIYCTIIGILSILLSQNGG
jgi:undecaprenyl-diphosphatase